MLGLSVHKRKNINYIFLYLSPAICGSFLFLKSSDCMGTTTKWKKLDNNSNPLEYISKKIHLIGHLFKFVQVIWLLMKVEPQQLSLQAFYESLAAEEIPDDAVRERVAVQLQISCTHQTNNQSAAWGVYRCMYVRYVQCWLVFNGVWIYFFIYTVSYVNL